MKPPGLHEFKTYGDFTTEGGPWTLLVISKSRRGWDADKIKQRNSDKPSLHDDFSILGFADAIEDFGKSQVIQFIMFSVFLLPTVVLIYVHNIVVVDRRNTADR